MNDKVTEPNSPEEEVEILYPDRTVTVAERQVTVREFRALEGMKLASKVRPIVDSLEQLSGQLDIGDVDSSLLERVSEEHADTLLDLMAQSSGQPREWVEQLPDEEFGVLEAAFWSANSGFFMRRLARSLMPVMSAAIQGRNGGEESA